MRIIVLWADPKSPNLGSQMIAEGIKSFLRIHSSASNIEFLSHSQLQVICQGKWYSIQGISKLKSFFKKCDFVIDMGDGDSFTGQYGLIRLIKLSTIRIIARLNSKKIMLGPQTIGEFSGVKLLIAKLSLYGVSAVSVRESASMRALPSIFDGPYAVATDTSWFIKSPLPSGERLKKCLINLNGLYFSLDDLVKRRTFVESIQSLSSALLQRGYSFDFMYHVAPNTGTDNDRIWEHHIVSEFPESRIFSPNNFLDARHIIAKYEFSVGSRYHFCLNSVQAGTPCIPIAYGKKFDSIYQNFRGSNDWGTAISISEWEHLIDQYCTLNLNENRAKQEKLLENFTDLYKSVNV